MAIGAAGGAALAAAAFWFFGKQAKNVADGRAEKYDTMAFDVVGGIDQPAMHRTMEAVTQLGSHLAIGTAAGLTALAMVRRGRRSDAWTVILSTGGAMALDQILKRVFRRQRPKNLARGIRLPKSHSFPSGHALMSAATYPIVVHHLVQDRSPATQAVAHALTGATVLSIGFTRVYFRVHYPSDVLAGFAAGLGWLGLTSLAHSIVEYSRRSPARLLAFSPPSRE